METCEPLFLLMGSDCRSELTLSTCGSFSFNKWHRLYFTCQVFTYVCSQMCLKKRVGEKSSLILIREQSAFSLLRELKIYHDICWLHSQNLSPPTTFEARQRGSAGAISVAGAVWRAGRGTGRAEVIFSVGPYVDTVIGEAALISPHKFF